jgi:hypothetical protein
VSVAEKTFGIGNYWTDAGLRVVVDAVTEDGQLIGRVNLQEHEGSSPIWYPAMWNASGKDRHRIHTLTDTAPKSRIREIYWLNRYPSGPGLLRKTWEEALIEASRSEEEVLCRVRVSIDACVGEGLR